MSRTMEMVERVMQWCSTTLAAAVSDALALPPASQRTMLREIANTGVPSGEVYFLHWGGIQFCYHEVSIEEVRFFECGGVTWRVTCTTGQSLYAEITISPCSPVDWERVLSA